MNEQTWSQWIRGNTDKFLLLAAFVGIVTFVLHVSHDTMDKELIAWGRELGSGFAAAFLTMVTGSVIRSAGMTPPAPLPPGSTATTQIKTVTPPAPLPDAAKVKPPVTESSETIPLKEGE